MPLEYNPANKLTCDAINKSELHGCAGCWFQAISIVKIITILKIVVKFVCHNK